jgi:anti-sigma B factor antagonist
LAAPPDCLLALPLGCGSGNFLLVLFVQALWDYGGFIQFANRISLLVLEVPYMATQPSAARGLTLQLEEKANETIIHCTGKINVENSEAFQREIRDLIPQSRGHVTAITCRIVLDLSNVTHVDSTGLGAILGAWTAAQRKGCELEISNLNPRVQKLVDTTRLDSVFKKMKDFFGSGGVASQD